MLRRKMATSKNTCGCYVGHSACAERRESGKMASFSDMKSKYP